MTVCSAKIHSRAVGEGRRYGFLALTAHNFGASRYTENELLDEMANCYCVIVKIKATIEHPLLPPFEPRLKALLELGFDGGIRALAAAGFKLGDDLVNDVARECFNNGLFSAFGETQSEVGELFIDLENQRRQTIEQLKKRRVARDPAQKETELLLEVIQNRQLILRRLMDGILCVLLNSPRITDHLVIKEDLLQPDPNELRRILAIAAKQNAGNKRELHLVSDLTTIVQIGDIVRLRWDENGAYIRLQEIKFGEVNSVICDILEAIPEEAPVAALAEIESRFGKHGHAQALRILKQQQRFKNFA